MTYPRRASDVNWQKQRDGIVLIHTDSDHNFLYMMNNPASHIWSRCNGLTKIEDFNHDQTGFLCELETRGLIEMLSNAKADHVTDVIKSYEGKPKISKLFSQDIGDTSRWYELLYRYLKNAQYGQFYRPQKVNFDVTYKCNLHCTHCYLHDMQEIEPDIIVIKEILGRIKDAGIHIVNIFGGEPFMRRDIVDIITYADSLGLSCIVNTNLMPLSKARILGLRSLSKGLLLNVSLDGADRDAHDSVRGKGSFDKTMTNLGYAIGAGIPVQINFTAMRHNAFQLPKVHSLVSKIGAKDLTVLLFNEIGRGKDNASNHRLRAKHLLYILAYEKIVNIMGRKPAVKVLPCTAYSFTHIDVVGNVHFCTMMPHGMAAGNILETDLMDIWHSKAMKDMHTFLSRIKEPCRSCAFLKYGGCIGGCRAQAYDKTGDFYAGAPYCMRRQIIADLVSMFIGRKFACKILRRYIHNIETYI